MEYFPFISVTVPRPLPYIIFTPISDSLVIESVTIPVITPFCAKRLIEKKIASSKKVKIFFINQVLIVYVFI